MTEYPKGLLDTNVIVHSSHHRAIKSPMPKTALVCCITAAELAEGIHQAKGADQVIERLNRFQQLMANFEPLPFDNAAVHAYSQIVALTLKAGRIPRPRRNDLMIAAIAAANQLPLYTENTTDFIGLESVLTVVGLESPPGD